MPSDYESGDSLRARIIGLGEKSIHKSYYPELKNRLAELERFRSMLDQSSNIIFIVNFPDFTIFDVTSPVTSQLGWKPEELAGSCFWDLVEVDVRERVVKHLSVEWHKSEIREVFISKIRGNIPLEFICSPVTLDGQMYVIIVAQEISKRLQAENQIQQQLIQLDTLHRIDTLITANLSLPDLLNGVLDEVCSVLHADGAAIYTFDTPEVLRCVALSGALEFKVQAPMEVPRTLFPELKPGCRVVLNTDETDQSRLVVIKNRVRQFGFSGYAGEPLSSSGKLKGILEVYFTQPFDGTAEWSALLTRLSAQVAVAVDKSQLFNTLQNAYVELNQAYDQTIAGWVAALELRERETAMHSRQVVDMTVRLAHLMGIKADGLMHIWRGAYLHDIGKMAIPDAILLKPGPLTDEEWEVMRQHPSLAYQMLSGVSYLRPALDIPYGHHEKWDGTGYPRGLAGENIPFTARIFAVVDVWQALTSDRVYRKAWPEENAINYIRDHSGTHFDPSVVAGFMSLINNNQGSYSIGKKSD
jgi:PAS domain S-box-containing protein